jgi:hypothetical protein
MQTFDVLILWGWAAGCFAPSRAGGRRVAVLEHADRVGKKMDFGAGAQFHQPSFGTGTFSSAMCILRSRRWHSSRRRTFIVW